MLKVYLLVYLFMPCKDRCDDDDGPRSTTIGLETQLGAEAFSKDGF